jgi:O-methyltransferase involved in polyketide biosynthesis
MRAFMAARSRYSEDRLARSVEGGTRQFVILGAGLDTFTYAIRTRIWAFSRSIIRRLRLGNAGASRQRESLFPTQWFLCPWTFASATWWSNCNAPDSKRRPAFFSWLGVTQYLVRKRVLATLKLIASLCPANGVVFDFGVSRHSLDSRNQAALDALARRVRAAGEPFEGFFDPAKLTQELDDMGFCHIEVLDAEQINTLYFRDRADGLCVRGRLARLMCAWS